jgi:hypothetical protein
MTNQQALLARTASDSQQKADYAQSEASGSGETYSRRRRSGVRIRAATSLTFGPAPEGIPGLSYVLTGRVSFVPSNCTVDLNHQRYSISRIVAGNASEVVTFYVEVRTVPIHISFSCFSEQRFDAGRSSRGNFKSEINLGHIVFPYLPGRNWLAWVTVALKELVRQELFKGLSKRPGSVIGGAA